MCDEPEFLWRNAQERQFQIRELMSSTNPCIGCSNLPHGGAWHTLLRQADLTAQVWPGLSSQTVALLCCTEMVVDLERSGTVVGFRISSRFRRFDLSRVCLLGLYNCKIRLLFQPGACKLSTASDPLLEGKPGSQSLHRIIPSHASSTIDLIVNMDSQDSTQTSRRTKVSRGDHRHLVVHLVPVALRFSQNKHTRIHRMLTETQLLNEEPPKRLPPLLWLISKAVPSLGLKKLVRVHALFDVRLRHGHEERSLRLLFPVSQQKRCLYVSDCHNETTRSNQLQDHRSTVRGQRWTFRLSISHQIQHVRIFEPLQSASTFHFLSSVIFRPQCEHRSWLQNAFWDTRSQKA